MGGWGKGGLSVRKQGVYQGLGKTWKQGFEPTERQKAIELKLEKESGCILLKFPGEERRNREIGQSGVSLKRNEGRWEKTGNLPLRVRSRTNQSPSHRSTPPVPSYPTYKRQQCPTQTRDKDKTLSYTRTQG